MREERTARGLATKAKNLERCPELSLERFARLIGGRTETETLFHAQEGLRCAPRSARRRRERDRADTQAARRLSQRHYGVPLDH